MRTRTGTMIAALAALALLTGGTTAGAAAPPNMKINAHGDGSIDANNTPSVAVNPTDPDNVIGVNRIDRPDFRCSFRVSFDGGATWQDASVPMPSEPVGKCYAPQAAFDENGVAYLLFVILTGPGNRPESLFLTSSTDGGATFGAPHHVLGEELFQVTMTIVGTRIHLTWLQGNETSIQTPGLGAPPNPIVTASSDDGGITFSEPVQVSDPTRLLVTGPAVAAGPNGSLHVAYLDLVTDLWNYEGIPQMTADEPPARLPYEVVLATSTDGGESFHQHTVAAGVEPIGNFLIYISPKPAIAAGPNGIAVAWTAGARGAQDVFVAHSAGGHVWGAPSLVTGGTDDEHTPALAVAPSGRVDLIYYSRAADDMTDVLARSSGDGGATWGAPMPLNQVGFDGEVGPFNWRGHADLGNRLALVSSDDGLLAAWADTRLGTRDTGRQDVYCARLEITA